MLSRCIACCHKHSCAAKFSNAEKIGDSEVQEPKRWNVENCAFKRPKTRQAWENIVVRDCAVSLS